jgi:hypothetical protein
MRITRTAVLAAAFVYAAVSVLSAAPPGRARVVATLQLGPITVPPGETTPWVTVGSWTQAPDDLNFLYGRLTATGPASCHRSGQALEGFFFEANGRVDEGELPESMFSAVLVGPFAPLAATLTRNFSRALGDINPLFGTSAPTLHTVEVRITNICENAGEAVIIDSILMKVVAIP